MQQHKILEALQSVLQFLQEENDHHHDEAATIFYDDDDVNDNMSDSSEGSRSSLAASITDLTMYYMPLDHPDHPYEFDHFDPTDMGHPDVFDPTDYDPSYDFGRSMNSLNVLLGIRRCDFRHRPIVLIVD